MSSSDHHKPAHARGVGRPGSKSRRKGRWVAGAVIVVIVAVAASVGVLLHERTGPAAGRVVRRTTTTMAPTTTVATTTTSTQLSSTSTGSSGTACIPVAAVGPVYVVGDSVMIDAQQVLQGCVPDIQINAAVSRQWSDGEAVMRTVMAEASPPPVVVIALGTNGPITDADFTSMMTILHSATRVVFVTVHVDRAWQDPNNAVLARGVGRYPNTTLADWESLASQHPEWFYSDGTHLPIDGAGADALASLVASKV